MTDWHPALGRDASMSVCASVDEAEHRAAQPSTYRWLAACQSMGKNMGRDEEADNLPIKTDSFGDFEFEGLEPNTEYTIKIEHDGYAVEDLNVRTVTDLNVGEIILKPA